MGLLRYNEDDRTASYEGKEATLTRMQGILLGLLVSANGGVCTRKQIENAIWPDRDVRSNETEVLIYNIRRKLRPLGYKGIKTINNIGYKLE